MEDFENCPLCGHKTASILGTQEGFNWSDVRCKNCFDYVIHQSVLFQISDGDKKEINKRKRLNCVYKFLMEKPLFNNSYLYQFFYEEQTKNMETSDPRRVNVASLMENLPSKTIDRINFTLKNLIVKYDIGNTVDVSEIDFGLVLIDNERELQEFLTYYQGKDLIRILEMKDDKIKKFSLNIKSKIYLEDGEKLNEEKQTLITNITNNDNSISIGDVKNLKKSNIGQNKVVTEKETKVNTALELNVGKENKKVARRSFFKKK